MAFKEIFIKLYDFLMFCILSNALDDVETFSIRLRYAVLLVATGFCFLAKTNEKD